MHKVFALFAALSVLVVASPAAAQNTTKIGIVDLQRALNEVEEGKKAKANLEKQMEQVRLKVEAQRTEVATLQEDLEANRMMWAPDVVAEKEGVLQQKMVAFQQMAMEAQQEMVLMEQELTSDILEKLYGVAQTVGNEDGFNLIIEASAVVYINGAMDITGKVISKFNNK
jgi:outer membrane protein